MSRGLTTRLRKLETKAGMGADIRNLSDAALDGRIVSLTAALGGSDAAAEAMREMNRPDLARLVDEMCRPQ